MAGATSCLDMQRIERKGGRLESSSALNEVNDQDDDGNYEQEVDQAAANVADEAKKPEHDQDDNYSPEHGYSFRFELNFRRRLSKGSSTRQAFSEHRVTRALLPI
jgi:hypothetical protein